MQIETWIALKNSRKKMSMKHKNIINIKAVHIQSHSIIMIENFITFH